MSTDPETIYYAAAMRRDALHLLPSVKRKARPAAPAYSEDNYEKTIHDLVGVSFSPLAGIHLTFLEPKAKANSSSWQRDYYFAGDYVEYGTGFKMRLHLRVSLDPGYFPLGVSKDALHCAARAGIEEYLNTCGYTIDENIHYDGLRSFTNVEIGNDTFDAFMKLDENIFEALHFDKWPDQIVFEETETALMFKAPADKFRGHCYGNSELGVNGYVLFVRKEAAPWLTSYVNQRIWLQSKPSIFTVMLGKTDSAEKRAMPVTTSLDVTRLTVIEDWDQLSPQAREKLLKAYEKTGPDRCFTVRQYTPDLFPDESLKDFGLADCVHWEDGVLSMGRYKDWTLSETKDWIKHAKLTLSDPDGWMVVSLQEVELFGAYRGLRAPLAIAVELFKDLQSELNRLVIQPESVPQPDPHHISALDAEVISTPEQYIESPGLWLRLTRAWNAFWSNEPPTS